MTDETNDYQSLESALCGLKPSSRLDRERLLFLAGQASARPAVSWQRSWFWPASSGLMTTVAACLAVALLADRGTQPRDIPSSVVAEINSTQTTPDHLQPALVNLEKDSTDDPVGNAASVRDYLENRELALAGKLESPKDRSTDRPAATRSVSREQLLLELMPGALPRPLSQPSGWSIF